MSSSRLLRVSLPLCCCLLLRVPGMTVQSFTMACEKIKSADSAPRTHNTVVIHHWTKHQFPVPDIHLSRETCQPNTGTRTACSRHRISSPVSVRVHRDVLQLLTQIVVIHCRDRQVELQVTCSFHISQRLLRTCQVCKCWRCE